MTLQPWQYGYDAANPPQFVKLKDVKAAADHLWKAAQKLEDARDACTEFSAEYWENHDQAINLFETVENLTNFKRSTGLP